MVSFPPALTPAYALLPASPALSLQGSGVTVGMPLQAVPQSVVVPPPQAVPPVVLPQASVTSPQAITEASADAPLLQRSKYRYKTFAQKHPRWNKALLAVGALALFVAIPALVQTTFSNTAHWLMRSSTRHLDKTPWVNGALSKAHEAFTPKTLLGLAARLGGMSAVLWGVGTLLNKEDASADTPNQWWWLPSDSSKESKPENQAPQLPVPQERVKPPTPMPSFTQPIAATPMTQA